MDCDDLGEAQEQESGILKKEKPDRNRDVDSRPVSI
jgi:hypothetical protein